VTVANVGGATAVGWRVTLFIGPHARITGADGADFRQDDATVTFTPRDATRVIAGGRVVRFTFDVRGPKAGEPTDCIINGQPCT
jgi:hypothetical protein